MKKRAAQKVNSKHGEQTVSEVTEQLANCRLDSQEKVATCKLPAKKENTQISPPDSIIMQSYLSSSGTSGKHLWAATVLQEMNVMLASRLTYWRSLKYTQNQRHHHNVQRAEVDTDPAVY